MAKPFARNPCLSIPYPSADELLKALTGATRQDREVVARLWITEGAPFAFSDCPGVYEDIRGWLASRLNLHPKEITLVGSARLGYSLAPSPAFGKPFSENSDLDLSVISRDLFTRLSSAHSNFTSDYRKGIVVPRSEHERILWEANIEFGERNIPRGFIDANKIPNFDRYNAAQQVNQSMWVLLKKLEVTQKAPRVQKVSTRAYKDWPSFIDRVSLNLRSVSLR
jgi:hypothetical protein